jgi:hypothetical protein
MEMGFFQHAEIALGRPEIGFGAPVILDNRIVAESDLEVKEEVGHP